MSISDNPHFSRIDRAPYELGHLLRQLPADFSSHSTSTHETLLIADAARQHADNANTTIMHGLEALGHLLFLAGTNTDYDLKHRSISNLGCLIQYLAVEAQFMQETESGLSDTVCDHRKRSSPPNKGANHA